MKTQTSNSFIKTGLLLGIIVALGKVLSFIRQLVIAWIFGANSLTDVYFMSDSIVALISSMLIFGFSTTILTFYSQKKENKGDTKLFASNWQYITLIIALITVIIIAISSPLIAVVFGGKMDYDSQKMMTFFIAALSLSVIPVSLSSIWGAFLEGEGCYYPTQLQGFVCSSIIIIILFCFKDAGIGVLVIAFFTGYLVHYLYIIHKLKQKNLLAIRKTHILSLENKPVFTMAIPAMLGSLVINFNHLVDKYLASGIDEGSVSVLYYAQVGSIDLVTSIVVFSIGALLLSKLAALASNNDNQSVTALMNSSIIALLVVSIPITIILFFCAQDLLPVLFGTSKVESSDIHLLIEVFKIYAISLLLIPIREVALRVHYAYKDTKNPLYNNLIGVLVNIVLSIILSIHYGCKGIAAATTISFFLTTLLSLITVRKHIGSLHFSKKGLVALLTTFISCVLYCFLINQYLMFDSLWFLRVIVDLFGVGVCFMLSFIYLKKNNLVTI